MSLDIALYALLMPCFWIPELHTQYQAAPTCATVK